MSGSKRISGMNIDVTLLGVDVQASKVTLTITDNTAVSPTGGVPDGFVDGDVTAEIEYEFTTKYLGFLLDAARSNGSFRGIEPDDCLFYAKAGEQELKIEVFGVKLIMTDLLDSDSQGGSALVHKIKGLVTSPEFVHINGIPYLSDDDTRHLLG
jgi:hypothetical protein